jgi:hypothetical protein
MSTDVSEEHDGSSACCLFHVGFLLGLTLKMEAKCIPEDVTLLSRYQK